MMQRAAEILEAGKSDFGKLMTLEMGKPLKAAIAEAKSAPGLSILRRERSASSRGAGQNQRAEKLRAL